MSKLSNTLLAGALASAAILGAMVGGSIVEARKASTEPTNLADYWDAHGCINHLDGSLYEGTADKLSEFPREDVCKEYVHHIPSSDHAPGTISATDYFGNK